MNLSTYSSEMLPAVETELQSVLHLFRSSASADFSTDNNLPDLFDMLHYHMGWSGSVDQPSKKGKRLRPLITLLACCASGADWQIALPAAAGVELIHNFSLIHDDIQDQSPLRHGRETVWQRWGAAQAINAGDLMFTLALLSVVRLDRPIPDGYRVKGEAILLNACMQLTRGQTLDLAYETCDTLPEADYWQMVTGKTAALLSAAARLGGLFAGAPPNIQDDLGEFGLKLGLAFQAQDDLLGIWGDQALTGKSSQSDLVSGKKSLPVVYALQQHGSFSRRWLAGPVDPSDVFELAGMLEKEGARDYALGCCDRFTNEALQALVRSIPANDARLSLEALAAQLLGRKQ